MQEMLLGVGSSLNRKKSRGRREQGREGEGLSFLEFNYVIMQSYDFYYMFQHYVQHSSAATTSGATCWEVPS